MHLIEADLLPKQVTLGHNLKIHHVQLSEAVCFQGICIYMVVASITMANYYYWAIIPGHNYR